MSPSIAIGRRGLRLEGSLRRAPAPTCAVCTDTLLGAAECLPPRQRSHIAILGRDPSPPIYLRTLAPWTSLATPTAPSSFPCTPNGVTRPRTMRPPHPTRPR